MELTILIEKVPLELVLSILLAIMNSRNLDFELAEVYICLAKVVHMKHFNRIVRFQSKFLVFYFSINFISKLLSRLMKLTTKE